MADFYEKHSLTLKTSNNQKQQEEDLGWLEEKKDPNKEWKIKHGLSFEGEEDYIDRNSLSNKSHRLIGKAQGIIQEGDKKAAEFLKGLVDDDKKTDIIELEPKKNVLPAGVRPFKLAPKPTVAKPTTVRGIRGIRDWSETSMSPEQKKVDAWQGNLAKGTGAGILSGLSRGNEMIQNLSPITYLNRIVTKGNFTEPTEIEKFSVGINKKVTKYFNDIQEKAYKRVDEIAADPTVPVPNKDLLRYIIDYDEKSLGPIKETQGYKWLTDLGLDKDTVESSLKVGRGITKTGFDLLAGLTNPKMLSYMIASIGPQAPVVTASFVPHLIDGAKESGAQAIDLYKRGGDKEKIASLATESLGNIIFLGMIGGHGIKRLKGKTKPMAETVNDIPKIDKIIDVNKKKPNVLEDLIPQEAIVKPEQSKLIRPGKEIVPLEEGQFKPIQLPKKQVPEFRPIKIQDLAKEIIGEQKPKQEFRPIDLMEMAKENTAKNKLLENKTEIAPEKNVKPNYKSLKKEAEKVPDLVLDDTIIQETKIESDFIPEYRVVKRNKNIPISQSYKVSEINRGLRGKHTIKEINKTLEKLNKNYIGKKVDYQGDNVTVVASPFGKVKIKFDDGTTKIVERSDILSKEITKIDALNYLQEQAYKEADAFGYKLEYKQPKKVKKAPEQNLFTDMRRLGKLRLIEKDGTPVKERGEIRALEDRTLINNKTGKSVDEMTQALNEIGYEFESSKDLMDSWSQGKKLRSSYDEYTDYDYNKAAEDYYRNKYGPDFGKAEVELDNTGVPTSKGFSDAIDAIERSVERNRKKETKNKEMVESTSKLIQDALAPLKDKLGEQKGSISMNKLTPEQLLKYEKSQKAIKELRRRTMSEARKLFNKLGKNRLNEYGVPYKSDDFFLQAAHKIGIPAEAIPYLQNKIAVVGLPDQVATRITPKGKEVPIKRNSGVYGRKELLTDTNIKDYYGSDFESPSLVSQIQDGNPKIGGEKFAGSVTEFLHNPTQDLVKTKTLFVQNRQNAGRKIAGKNGFNVRDNKSAKKLRDMMEKIDNADMHDMTSKQLFEKYGKKLKAEKKYFDAAVEIRDFLDQMWRSQNKVRDYLNKEKINYRQKYIHHMERAATIKEFISDMLNKRDVQSIYDLNDYIFPNQKVVSHTKSRKGKITRYEDNIWKILDRYVEGSANDMFVSQAVENIKAQTAALEAAGKPLTAQWWRDYAKYSLLDKVNKVDERFGFVKGSKRRWLAQKKNDMLQKMALTFNPKFWFVTMPSSMALTVKEVGPINAVKGIYNYIKNPSKYDSSRVMKIKTSGDSKIASMSRGGARSNIYRTKRDIFNDIANIPANFIERLVTGSSVAGAELKGKQLGLTGKGLRDYKSWVGEVTQSIYNKESRPMMTNSVLFKALFPFQSFSMELQGHVKRLAGKGVQVNKLEKAKQIAYAVSAMYLMNLYGEMMGRDDLYSAGSFFPVGGDIANEAVDYAMNKAKELTGVGEVDESALSRYGSKSYVMAPFEDGVRVGDAIVDVIEKNNWKKMRQEMIKWITAAGGIGGGVQINRFVDGIIALSRGYEVSRSKRVAYVLDQDDPLEVFQTLLMGPYASEGGKDYIEHGFKPLGKKQTERFKKLKETKGQDAAVEYLNKVLQKRKIKTEKRKAKQ